MPYKKKKKPDIIFSEKVKIIEPWHSTANCYFAYLNHITNVFFEGALERITDISIEFYGKI